MHIDTCNWQRHLQHCVLVQLRKKSVKNYYQSSKIAKQQTKTKAKRWGCIVNIHMCKLNWSRWLGKSPIVSICCCCRCVHIKSHINLWKCAIARKWARTRLQKITNRNQNQNSQTPQRGTRKKERCSTHKKWSVCLFGQTVFVRVCVFLFIGVLLVRSSQVNAQFQLGKFTQVETERKNSKLENCVRVVIAFT